MENLSSNIPEGVLAAALDRQHHEDYEAQIRAVEQHRQEIASING